jgi:leucyl aminopeptidase (aminopeptidase T)
MSTLQDAARNAVFSCMAVKPGESVLVVTDKPLRAIGHALWDAACEARSEAMLLEIIPRAGHGSEPPAAVAGVMKSVDVLLCPTSCSLSHTEARRAASDAGVRIATLPGITEDCMIRTLTADYSGVAELSVKVARVLTGGREVRVTSPAGTDVSFSIAGRAAHADTGLVRNPGDFSNLPAGEAFLAPVEGTANGRIVFEAAVAGLGKLGDDKITLEIRDGFAISFTGGEPAQALEKMLAPHGEPGRNLAELGVGTNSHAIVTGKILEDEKILGTVHFALGNNKSMGGEVGVPIHLDGLVQRPSVWVDGKQMMSDGKLSV